MATSEKHVEKADRNAAFARSLTLDSPAHIEWALTSAFYSGLHYVEAYLAKLQPESTHNTHAKRDKLMVMDSKLRSVQREYFDLKQFGMKARYYCQPIRASALRDDAFPALEMIRAHIRELL